MNCHGPSASYALQQPPDLLPRLTLQERPTIEFNNKDQVVVVPEAPEDLYLDILPEECNRTTNSNCKNTGEDDVYEDVSNPTKNGNVYFENPPPDNKPISLKIENPQATFNKMDNSSMAQSVGCKSTASTSSTIKTKTHSCDEKMTETTQRKKPELPKKPDVHKLVFDKQQKSFLTTALINETSVKQSNVNKNCTS